mgnify:CR=1 FL=1
MEQISRPGEKLWGLWRLVGAVAALLHWGGRCFSPVGSGVGGDSWTSEEEALFMSLDTPAKVQVM